MSKPNAAEFVGGKAGAHRLQVLLHESGWTSKDAAEAIGMDLGLFGRKLRGEISHRYDFQYIVEQLTKFKAPRK